MITVDKAKDILDGINDCLASGQGMGDYMYPWPDWKRKRVKEQIKDLTTEERKLVWAAGKPWKVGTGEGDSTHPTWEIRALAKLLGVKIQIKSAEVIDL